MPYVINMTPLRWRVLEEAARLGAITDEQVAEIVSKAWERTSRRQRKGSDAWGTAYAQPLVDAGFLCRAKRPVSDGFHYTLTYEGQGALKIEQDLPLFG